MKDEFLVKINGEDYIKVIFPFIATGQSKIDRFNATRTTLGVIEVSTKIDHPGGLFTHAYGHITALVPLSKITKFYNILED